MTRCGASRDYTSVGRLLGRALLDDRLLDLPLSLALVSLIRGDVLTSEQLASLDPQRDRALRDLENGGDIPMGLSLVYVNEMGNEVVLKTDETHEPAEVRESFASLLMPLILLCA